ncbi:choice-of-anchor C family protein [Streptomyces sp. NPDC059680]|uniref:choice-of-anchor C family protein n=1 Tax=Streptomyces sp. NPDC059680 TaxID=3346904 RepID=UPI0036B8A5FF
MFATRACVTAAAATLLLTSAAGTAVAAPAHSSGRAASSSVAAPLDDGSFETPEVMPDELETYVRGQFIGPWKVTQATVDLYDGVWKTADGQQFLDLNGTEGDLANTHPGAVSQTFATTPGRSYTVTYALAGNIQQGPVMKTGKVLIDGQDFQDFSFDTTGKTAFNMGWVKRQMTFVATGKSTTLTFASTTAHTASGPLIDDITVERNCLCDE